MQTPPQDSSNLPQFPRFTEKTPINELLARNRAWADRQSSETPVLFPTLARSQSPQILWIGCSDSRVPETTVLDLLPGDLFVHRNIANIVSSGDLSVLSVVQFAVEVLGVNHIIICGMYPSLPLQFCLFLLVWDGG
jgi:carbonic anhydrase